MSENVTQIVMKDVKSVIKFLTTVMRYVDRGKFEISKDMCGLYCKNPSEQFNNSRLILKTNLITLSDDSDLDSIVVSFSDFSSLKSSLSIIDTVTPKQISGDDVAVKFDVSYTAVDGQYIASEVSYVGETEINLKTVNPEILSNFVTTDLKSQITGDWTFHLDPVNWNILLSKTASIVNYDTSSLYLYSKNNKVFAQIASRTTTYNNSIGLYISDKYQGEIPADYKEVSISDSSFRMFNLLQLNDSNNIIIKYNHKNKVFVSESVDKDDNGFYVACVFLCRIIVGK